MLMMKHAMKSEMEKEFWSREQRSPSFFLVLYIPGRSWDLGGDSESKQIDEIISRSDLWNELAFSYNSTYDLSIVEREIVS